MKQFTRLLALALSLPLLLGLFSACAAKKNDDDVSLSVPERGAELLAAASFDDVMRGIDQAVADSLLGTEGKTAEVCAYAAESGATAEILLLARCASPEDAAAVVSSCADYRDAQIADFTTYNPPEVPKLERALIVRRGRYVLYCVARDAAALSALFDGYFDV